jgi:hypothetical protein
MQVFTPQNGGKTATRKSRKPLNAPFNLGSLDARKDYCVLAEFWDLDRFSTVDTASVRHQLTQICAAYQ